VDSCLTPPFDRYTYSEPFQKISSTCNFSLPHWNPFEKNPKTRYNNIFETNTHIRRQRSPTETGGFSCGFECCGRSWWAFRLRRGSHPPPSRTQRLRVTKNRTLCRISAPNWSPTTLASPWHTKLLETRSLEFLPGVGSGPSQHPLVSPRNLKQTFKGNLM